MCDNFFVSLFRHLLPVFQKNRRTNSSSTYSQRGRAVWTMLRILQRKTETLVSHHVGSLIRYLTGVFAATAFKWTICKNKNVVNLEIASLRMNCFKICLDTNVLKVAIKARCDMGADDINFSSNSFRKAAYRQYIIWRYSLLAAVFCVGPILPPHKRLLNRAGHAIPIV